jgi:hypothetical protein
MLKQPPMVVGTDLSSPTLDLAVLKVLLIGDLPYIVLSDEPITKMHDSLPMILFRFGVLIKLYEAREFAWVAFFVPWVMLNEAMSHQQARTVDRLGWLRVAYCYLMHCVLTYRDSGVGPGMAMFARRDAPEAARRVLFDNTLLMHAANTIGGIIYEMRNARKPISL